MPKRQTKRKVLIRYVGRRPDDPLALLEAVEEAFRPKDIEISVEIDEESPPMSPNEQVETMAREAAAQTLDERHRDIQNADSSDQRSVTTSRRRIATWVSGLFKSGWGAFVSSFESSGRWATLFGGA